MTRVFRLQVCRLEKMSVNAIKKMEPGSLLTDNYRVLERLDKKDKRMFPDRPWYVVHGALLAGEMANKADNEFGKIRKVKPEEVTYE